MKCSFQIANCELYVFSFKSIDSKMYLLLSNNKAIIIDPCIDEDALYLLKQKNTQNIIVLPTHEHYDHISGINWLKNNTECTVIAIDQCAKKMTNPIYNFSSTFSDLFIFSSEEIQKEIRDKNIQPYTCQADEMFSEYKCFIWEEHEIEIISTPGHSKGSVCIVIDKLYVFTGDSLIKGMPVITRLTRGSKKEFQQITLAFLKSLPPKTIIFPGHGEAGYIEEFEL